jgi:hypothetical protein
VKFFVLAVLSEVKQIFNYFGTRFQKCYFESYIPKSKRIFKKIATSKCNF